MKWLVSLSGVLASVEVYYATTGHLGLNAGVAFLIVAPFAGVWAFPALVRPQDAQAVDSKLRAERALIFCYEFLIIGSSNALVGSRVPYFVATSGAAALVAGQSLILLLIFKNPRIIRPAASPPSPRNLSVRVVIALFFYLAIIILAVAVFVPRSGHPHMQSIPIDLQWPGIALLYAGFACLAIGFSSERSNGNVVLYSIAIAVSASAAYLEYIRRRDWYFLALSLISSLILVPGWPLQRTSERTTAGRTDTA